MADLIEINAATGEVIERDFTPEEKKQRKADEAAAKKAEKARIAEEAKAKQDRADAIDHAKSLGFTDDMIAQMFPGLGE